MRHDFEVVYAHQWSEIGSGYDSAHSVHKCKVCGVKFTHYYHDDPNIYNAIEKVGIDGDGCTPQEKEKK